MLPNQASGEKLRILLVARTLAHGGGAESLVFNIYNELKTRPGLHVKLVAFQKSDEFNIANGDYYENALSGDPDFSYCNSYVNLSIIGPDKSEVTQFKRLVEDFKPHIIHSNLFSAELVSREFIYPAARYFTHCHDNMRQLRNFGVNTLFKKGLLTDYYEKRHVMAGYLKCNNNFISISDDTTTYFKSVLPRAIRKNIYQLDNAILAKTFRSNGAERDFDKIRIVNVGSFQLKKNQKFLVSVAAELVKRGRDVQVNLLGQGSEYNNVKAEVEKNGLQQVVLMPGNVVNVEDYYAAANIYVHSATYEPFGLVLLEAMLSGLPVLSLDGKGNRSLVKNGETGFLLFDQNPVQFADMIEKIVGNKKAWQILSNNAIEFARDYDIKNYVDRLLAVYQKGAGPPIPRYS